jgi:hypothetical protein
MAVRRSQNWLNQQRVDVPHLRSIESAVRNDFDELLSSVVIGEDASYVVRGFELNMVGAIGSSASSLQMIVENSSLLHGNSDNAGTFFEVATGTPNETLSSTTNTKVVGSFTPSATNYVGIELVRAVDNATTAQVFLWNPTNKTEISRTVPLAETFDYNIIITSSIWASNVLPIAVVETDGSNNVLSVDDRRPMLLRLGTAGTSTPDPFYKYDWSTHAEGREENFWSSSSAVSPFRGGDKQLLHLKEWMDAVMSQILEIKGTTYWYSENKGGSIIKLRGDIANLQMTGSGQFTHATVPNTDPGQINWDSDIYLNFIGSRLRYKINSYPVTEPNSVAADKYVTLADNQVAYINIVRGVDVVPNLIFTNGSAIVSSVGAVSWTGDVLAGDYIKVGSEDDTQYFEIQSVDSASQVTLTETFDGTSTGSGGVQAKYAWGTYQTDAAPSTDRHIRVVDRKDVPFLEDVYWLFLRQDDGAAAAQVYIRGSAGGELEQGESREISDNTTNEILEYIGSASEVDTDPDYLNAIATAAFESRTITFPAGGAVTSGQYFTISSALDIENYYVDAIVDASDADPAPAGLTRAAVNILSTDTNVQVAAKYHAIIDALGEFDSTDNLDGTITVTNSQAGACTDAANVDMPGPFAIVTDTQGVGAFNRFIFDGENLTKSIKRLDEAIGLVTDASDIDPYEEKISIIAGAPSDADHEITGPVAASTSVKLPRNSRNADVQETYTIGEAEIVISLNGNRLCVGKDYTESSTTEVQFTFQLEVDDELVFEKAEALSSFGGGTSSGQNLGTAKDADVFKQNVGSVLQFRRLQAGSNVSISETSDSITISSSAGVANSTVVNIVGVNHTFLTTEDVAIVTNSGTDLTITLPDATAANGKIYHIKKIDAGNTTFVKSVSGQTLDGVDIDASPLGISIQYENITVISNGANWFIL